MWHSLVVRSVRDRKVASSNLVTSTMAVKHRLIYQKTAKAVFFHLWRVLPPFVKASFHEFFNRIKLKGKFAPFFETFIIRKILILRKVEEKAARQNIIYYVLAKACFRDGLLLRFSQKVTQAELFARCSLHSQ